MKKENPKKSPNMLLDFVEQMFAARGGTALALP